MGRVLGVSPGRILAPVPPLHRLAVVPDVHMRRGLFEEAVRLHEQGCRVVFLGDYVDNGPRANDPVFLRELFGFCREAHATPLLGNHDLAYVFPDREDYRINGYEPATAAAVAEVYAEYAADFAYVHRVGKYVFSHAGLGQPLLNALALRYGAVDLDDAVAYLNERQPPELFFRSRYNGGTDAFDGPTWLRLPQFHGALAEEGITQVVGHSSQAVIRLRHNMLMIDVKRALVLEWAA